ncbi:MAG: c-type cytochrome [Planctomycetota bacterium]
MIVVGLASCSGPQSLDIAIRPADQEAYVEHLNDANGVAWRAFSEWMATERGIPPEMVLAEDRSISATRNPFDAYREPQSVSRGAVIYQFHCARCHGDDTRGQGPSTLPGYPAKDFHGLIHRFASTMHRGAPRKWFRVISQGAGEEVDYPDERTTAMPSFGDSMTRAQIWLVITYLQSLDIHAEVE